MTTKSGSLLLSLVMAVTASCGAAFAADGTLYGIYQGHAGRGKSTVHEHAQINWSNWLKAEEEKRLHIVSEQSTLRGALVVNLHNNQQISSVSFSYEKFKRGHLYSETTDPIVSIEYSSVKDPTKKLFAIARTDHMTLKKVGKKTEATLELRQVDGADPIVHRIGIVGVAKKGLVVPDYADFDVWNLRTNKSSDYDVQLKFIEDNSDPVLNHAVHEDSGPNSK